MRRLNERGSVAVEFALIVPVFVLLVFGVIEFSNMYNQQLAVTNAARSAVRTMSIGNSAAAASAAGIAAAPGLRPAPTAANFSYSPPVCTSGETMTATVTYNASFLTGLFGSTLTLKGKAAMPCGG
ncbi:MAG TPA: TadE family protein [Candidatus Lumbricidophila sp.]|nr:TadE family protein [Candidatus Lumbricidophila sp.]